MFLTVFSLVMFVIALSLTIYGVLRFIASKMLDDGIDTYE